MSHTVLILAIKHYKCKLHSSILTCSSSMLAKRTFGEGLPLLWTFAQICYKSFSQTERWMYVLCYNSRVDRVPLLLICSCFFSFFPVSLQFLHEAFSQAGKHNYKMHVLYLITVSFYVSYVCYTTCNIPVKLTIWTVICMVLFLFPY